MVNVAVIGTGNMGRNHARVYFELDKVKLVAIADINEEGKKIAKGFGSNFYKDYKKMLEKEDIDAVSIAVPTSLHKKVALDCINKGKHILIEKPIADTLENAREIINAAHRKDLKLMVGHIERFNPAVLELKNYLEKKKLGKITSIIARRVGIFPPQIKDANVILDLAVHDIDIFSYLLEKEPIEVYAKAGDALATKREDHSLIVIAYGDSNCFIQVNWLTPVKIRNLAITGSKGYAELNYITQDLKIYKTHLEKTFDTFKDFVLKFGTPKETRVEIKKEEPLKVELKHFIECVEKNKTPLATGEDGFLALKIAHLAINSYKKNRPVKLSEER